MPTPTPPTQHENAEYWKEKAVEAKFLTDKYKVSTDTAWLVVMLSSVEDGLLAAAESLQGSIVEEEE